jgi:hypothetical protein
MLARLKQQIKAWSEKNSKLIKRLGWSLIIFYLIKAIIYMVFIAWVFST